MTIWQWLYCWWHDYCPKHRCFHRGNGCWSCWRESMDASCAKERAARVARAEKMQRVRERVDRWRG